MNILILTNSHPMNIVELGNSLHTTIKSDNTEILGIQSMALMAENVEDVKYKHNIFILANALRRNPEIVKSKKKYTIFYGNLDKRTNIKFDHIFYYSGYYDDTDAYLAAATEEFKQLSDINVEWYNQSAAEYSFISLDHLYLMLKTIGVEINEQ